MTVKTSVPDKLTDWAELHGFDRTNINSRIKNGMSPLMLAAMQGNLTSVSLLLIANADVNLLNDDENNALWFACFSDQIPIAQELLHYGCDINNQNVNGATCLIYAASAGKYDIASELIQSGADLSKQTLDGYNALDCASTLPILKMLSPLYNSNIERLHYEY